MGAYEPYGLGVGDNWEGKRGERTLKKRMTTEATPRGKRVNSESKG